MRIKSLFYAAILIIAINISFAQQNYEATTVLKEKFLDKNGKPLTGKGVLVGDVDSGIDIFHPMFFFADGGEFDWIDVDGDGKFTPGVDGVDLNKDGKISNDEILRWFEIKDNTWGMLASMGDDPRRFDPGFDFLYADKNGNKKRDFGPDAGFTENDPSYSEPTFIAIDANNNGQLDAGEKIVMLKTSKVRAVRERTGNIRRRGVDLIYTEQDSVGHGTGVAGLILGGHDGVQKIHGIAPDAEIVVSSIRYNYTPRFVRNFTDLIQFCKDEKVNVLLFEDGEWMWEFMDGSSLEEQMVNQMAADGVTVVGGSGNMSGGNMVLMDTIKSGATESYYVSCSGKPDNDAPNNNGVFFSFLWTNADGNLSFTITSPDGSKSSELTGSGYAKVGDYNIYYGSETSPKGTNMFKVGCSKSDSSMVKGKWTIKIKATAETIIRAYVVDVTQSWSGSARWVNSMNITDESNICFPSTADSMMAIGAYTVNYAWGFTDQVGALCTYSSKGINLDGKLGVEVTAPGHSTFSTQTGFGWQIFSGTSSAAPHVVGTAVLLLQYNPSLTHSQIHQILRNSAVKDRFTGNLPNNDWGYGKLSIEGALKYASQNF